MWNTIDNNFMWFRNCITAIDVHTTCNFRSIYHNIIIRLYKIIRYNHNNNMFATIIVYYCGETSSIVLKIVFKSLS